jgi:Ca-activated chloride channel homolog
VLVVDTSSSMDTGDRLDAARVALRSFVSKLSTSDNVALITSGAEVKTVVPLGATSDSARVKRGVSSLFPNGGLSIYPAVSRALDAVRGLHDASRINAVVVLTDGASTSNGYRALLERIDAEGVTEGTRVRIFTVAYGDNANDVALERIADRSGGAFYSGRPRDINRVYRKISSYF